jgi:hypothetical protein
MTHAVTHESDVGSGQSRSERRWGRPGCRHRRHREASREDRKKSPDVRIEEFDEGEEIPLDFSDQAIRRLKRHSVPFAGALKLVDICDLRPCPEDPDYIRLRDSYPDVLTRRFEAIRIKLGELLGQLVQAQRTPVECVNLDPDGNQGMILEMY